MMKKTWLLFVLAFLLSFSSIWVSAADGYPCTDLKASFTGYGSIVVGDGSVTMTVQGAKTSEKNGTLTLTNEGDVAAQLSFSYSATGDYGSFTLADKTVDASGSYNAEIAAGGTVVLYMTVPKSGLFSSAKKGYITLTNVKLEVASDAELTVSHNAAGTISIDGTTVKSGSTVDISASGASLVATPGTGATFLGWINTVDNSVVSTSASFSYVPTGNASLKAIFAHADIEASFWGSSKAYLFESLSAAIAHAKSASNKTIVLAGNGTLSAGNYTIPSGITLLLPFDSAGTCYTTSPGYESGWTKPSAYYTLTMSSGANITVNGAISLSAKVSTKQGSTGAPTKKYGHISMNSGSTITVNSGGNLYAWGYISGDGEVLIKSGATVYESFQVVDWRGGTASSGMLGNKHAVFPMSQYYLQNVEVLMTWEAGAAEMGSMIADIISVRQVVVKFLGSSGCMFNLTSGTASKYYDGGTDRTNLNINGDFSVSNTKIELVQYLYSISTGDYNLPISNGYTLNVNSGTLTFDVSVSFLAGSQLNIAEGASVKVTNGAKLFVYDETEWKSNYYVFSNAYFRPVRYAVSRTSPRENDDIIDARIIVNGTLDASAGYLYTTASGASVCSTGNGVVILQAPESTPTLYEATQSGTDISYSSISVTSAQLQHADGTYLGTGAGTYKYNKDHGKWVKGEHTITSVVTAPTCTEDGYTTYTCTCGYSYTDSTVDALGHNYSEEVTSAPTCTEEGVLTFTCTACGDSYTEAVQSTGHNYDKGVVTLEPTCTATGTKVYTCHCGDSYEEAIDALGHSAVTDAAVAPTCTETGLTEGSHCSVCGEILVAQETVDALGHSYDSVVTEPTCTEAGYTTHTCSTCGDSYTDDEVAAKGHDYKSVVTEPTCTEAGYTTYTCACGESYISDEVAATGHSYGGWVVDGDTKTRTCGGCGETATRLVGEMNHLYSVQDVLYYNGSFDYSKDAKEIVFRDPQGNVLNTILCVQDSNGVIYLTYAMPSNVILDVVEFVIWIDGVQTDVFEINFDSYADTQTGTNYENVAQAIVDYGNASSTYFGKNEISEITAKYTSEPESGMSIKHNATESTSLDTYGASFVFDEYIAIKIYLSGNYTFKDGCTYQVGVLFGDETTSELNVNSIGNLCKAYVLYNTLEDVEISESDWVSPISAASADISKVPVLANKPGVQINLESVEYSKRFAIRAYLIECNAEGNQTVYYGRQVNYGLEDYVCSMYNRTDEVLKTSYKVDNPKAFKQFLIETWNYAVAAKETKWAE